MAAFVQTRLGSTLPALFAVHGQSIANTKPVPEDVLESLDLAGRTILVVEDEPLICLDIATRLQNAGAQVFAASRLDKAMRFADHPDLSAGVLDFDLGSADSSPVCWKLAYRHIPFLFHTARAHAAFQQWPAAPVLLKPIRKGLIASVAALFR